MILGEMNVAGAHLKPIRFIPKEGISVYAIDRLLLQEGAMRRESAILICCLHPAANPSGWALCDWLDNDSKEFYWFAYIPAPPKQEEANI